jgi:hypothetical protein
MKCYAHQKIPRRRIAAQFIDEERLAQRGRGQPVRIDEQVRPSVFKDYQEEVSLSHTTDSQGTKGREPMGGAPAQTLARSQTTHTGMGCRENRLISRECGRPGGMRVHARLDRCMHQPALPGSRTVSTAPNAFLKLDRVGRLSS